MAWQDSFKFKRGFTLLEMAVSLLVLGLLAVPVLMYYNNWIVEERKEKTFDNVVDVVEKLNNYRALNGFYPLPALLDDDRSDDTYGRAISTPCWTAQNPVPIDGGPFDDPSTPNPYSGISKQVTVRGEDDLTGAGRYVCLGFVPFREIQIEEKNAYDAYGGRIFYAVTVSATDINTIDDAAGAIAVRDADGNSLSPIDGDMTFVVFSAGANKTGAYNRNGILVRDCSGSGLETINCDMSNEIDSQFIATFDRTDFDDVVQYFSDNRIPLWQRDLDEIENIRDISPRGVVVGQIVGDGDVQLEIALPTIGSGSDSLHVRGAYQADFGGGTESNAQGLLGMIILPEDGLICDRDADLSDPDNTDCISLAEFQEGENFDCPDEEIAIGIKDRAVNCVPEEEFRILCPEETPIFLGVIPDSSDIDEDGDTDEIIANCAEVPVNNCSRTLYNGEYSCNETLPLPEKGHGAYHPGPGATDLITVSDCGRVNFICDNGDWEPSIVSGYCFNFPNDPPEGGECEIDCNDNSYGYDDGNLTGTYCTNEQYACMDVPVHPYYDIVEGDTFFEDCVCDGDYEDTFEKSCSEYFDTPLLSGTVTITREWSGNGVPGECEWTEGEVIEINCSCDNPDPYTERTRDCPDGQAGEWRQERNWLWDGSDYTTCRYDGWRDVENTCGCDMDQEKFNEVAFTCDDNMCEVQEQPLVTVEVPIGEDSDKNCIWSEPVFINHPDYPDSEYSPDPYPVASCQPKTFTWKYVDSTNQQNEEGVPDNAIIIGDACSCTDHENTSGRDSAVICYSGNSDIMDRCKCLP